MVWSALASVGAVVFSASVASAADFNYSISRLGEFNLPSGTLFDSTLVGGLSSLDYDLATGTYWAISDDRGNDRPDSGPARAYNLSIDLDDSGINDVAINSVVRFREPDGSFYGDGLVDPEGLRLASDGTFYYSSEGIRQNVDGVDTRVDPFVRQADASGRFLRELAVPSYFSPGPVSNTATGVRSNFGFESLTLTPNGNVVTVNENALIQDGPAATFGIDGITRFLIFDPVTGNPTNSYVYLADPPAEPSNPPEATAFTGNVEILALSETDFLVLERTFAIGGDQSRTGNRFIEIYHASTNGATDVLGLDGLAGQAFTPMAKTRIADLNTLFPFLTNVEGLTWGPDLPNGDSTLVLSGDNNFSANTDTQFLTLRVAEAEAVPEAETSLALMAVGLGLLALRGRRTRR